MNAEGTDKLCLIALLMLLAVAALGHVQGLRGVLAVLVGVCALSGPIHTQLRPVAAAWLLWLLLGLASVAWSVLPEATLRTVLYEMLLPFVTFLGAARMVRSRSALDAVALALLVGLAALAALSANVYLSGNAAVLLMPAEAKGILRFHPGVGVASTFAALAYPIWLMQWRDDKRWRVLSVLAIGCVLIVGAAAPNRMFWITLFGATLLFLLSGKGRSGAGPSWKLPLAILIAAAVSSAFFVLSLHQRGYSVADGWTKLGQSVTSESRFVGWGEWFEQATKKPALGAGFGKAAARLAYSAALPEDLARIDKSMIDHAHNMLLNIQLQLGAAGLMAFLLLLAVLLRLYLQGRSDPRTEAAARAGIALVAAMLLKNATDDFMGHAIVLVFWGIAGALVGFVNREANRAPIAAN